MLRVAAALCEEIGKERNWLVKLNHQSKKVQELVLPWPHLGNDLWKDQDRRDKYSRVDYQLQWKALEREPRLSPSREQNW